jgi:hypothetical protein
MEEEKKRIEEELRRKKELEEDYKRKSIEEEDKRRVEMQKSSSVTTPRGTPSSPSSGFGLFSSVSLLY